MKKHVLTLGALCALSFIVCGAANADSNDFGGPSLGSILASDGVFVEGAGPTAHSAWKRGSDGAFIDDNGAAYAAAAANPHLAHATEITTNGLWIPSTPNSAWISVDLIGGDATLQPGDDLHLNLMGGTDLDTGIVSGGNTVYSTPAVTTPFNFIVNNPAFDDSETGGSGNWYSDDSLNGNPGGTDQLGFVYNKHFRIFRLNDSTEYVAAYYIGLEDLPSETSGRYFNDLVFQVIVWDSTIPFPEPAFYQMGALLLGGGLLLLHRRRRQRIIS